MFLDLREYELECIRKRAFRRGLHRFIIFFLIYMSVIAQVGCKGPDGGSEGLGDSAALNANISASNNTAPDPGSTNLVVRLSDAPFPFQSVARADVTISSVQAQIFGDGFGGFFQISSQPITINLLDLRGGLSYALVETRVPNGIIRQLRLMVVKASVTLKDGRVFDMKIPSGPSSGLKIFLDSGLQVDGEHISELMLDFDVSRSFVVQGNPETPAGIKGFIFKPVIRVGNSSQQGTISGEVYSDNCTPNDISDDTPITDAAIEAIPDAQDMVCGDHTPIESAIVGSGTDGKFIVFALNRGFYELKMMAPNHGDLSIRDVAVEKARNTNLGRIILAKNCTDGSGGGGGGSDDDGSGSSSGGDSGGADSSGGTATDGSGGGSTDSSGGTDNTSGGSTTDGTQTSPTEWSVIGFDATSQATSMQIFWQSAVPTTGVIYIGLSSTDLSFQVINVDFADTAHVVFIENLIPSTTFYLKVVATDALGITHESLIIAKSTKAL